MRLASGESNSCKQIFVFLEVCDPTDFCLNTLAADVLLMRTKQTLGKWSHFNLVVWVKGGRAGELLQFLKQVIMALLQWQFSQHHFHLKQVTHSNGIGDYLQAITEMSSSRSLQLSKAMKSSRSHFYCYGSADEQYYLHKFHATNSAITFWIEFSNYCNWMQMWTKYIDLGLIPKCDCHQLFISLLWYLKPEASLNYVAN